MPHGSQGETEECCCTDGKVFENCVYCAGSLRGYVLFLMSNLCISADQPTRILGHETEYLQLSRLPIANWCS